MHDIRATQTQQTLLHVKYHAVEREKHLFFYSFVMNDVQRADVISNVLEKQIRCVFY